MPKICRKISPRSSVPASSSFWKSPWAIMAIALYGEASGDVRRSDMFRSKYAKDDAPTFVEFTFSYRSVLSA